MALVTLYALDRRISTNDICSSRTIPFCSRDTARVVHDIVAAHFGVDKEWDKKLLKCAFLDSPQFNWFEFDKKDSPQITLGITLSCDRTSLFKASLEGYFVPLERPGRIFLKTFSVFCNSECTLDYPQIKTERKTDYSVVALFNCDSFKAFMECSTHRGFARYAEKIEHKSKL